MATIKPIPQPSELEPTPEYDQTPEEQARALIIHPRIDVLVMARRPYEPAMERSLWLYSGKSRPDPSNPKNEKVVIPMARVFVEAKTAEEVKSMNPYQFESGKDPNDEWKTQLIKDVDQHVRIKVKMGPKKIQAIRMKNLVGLSILRVGYRQTMRLIRDKDLENPGAWKSHEVPVYDDLFLDLVSPFNFAVDPNATTMDDAMDCVQFHTENYEAYYENYCKNPQFKNTDQVKPGYNNMIDICEYFNKIRDQWVIYAAPARHQGITRWAASEIPKVEIYEGPLPDSHKELPFVSYHNNPSFVSGFARDLVARSPDGSDIVSSETVRAEEGFWTEGDPQTLMDLIDLRTGFGRAAYKAMKRAGEYIIATDPGFVFDESRPWRTGDQAVGAKGKFEAVSLGSTQSIQGFEYANDNLMREMILACGIDPNNLATDTKQVTATEAAIRRETSMRRLETGLEYNEENGEVRLGTIVLKLIEENYGKPELVRLLGHESTKELESFDDTVDDPDTGLPYIGKRFRSIKTKMKIKEKKRKLPNGQTKYTLMKSDEGGNSFLARPEYIRGSDIHVTVQSGRKAGEIKSIAIAQDDDFIKVWMELAQYAMPQAPGVQPLISAEDLPNIKKLVEKRLRDSGLDPTQDIGTGPSKKNPQEKQQEQANQQMQMNHQPINPSPIPKPV